MRNKILQVVAATMLVTAWGVFVWAVVTKPELNILVSLLSLAFSCLNLFLVGALWVFCLSRMFSTHQVRWMDIRGAGSNNKFAQSFSDPLKADANGKDDLDKWAKDMAQTLINPTKENLTDQMS